MPADRGANGTGQMGVITWVSTIVKECVVRSSRIGKPGRSDPRMEIGLMLYPSENEYACSSGCSPLAASRRASLSDSYRLT